MDDDGRTISVKQTVSNGDEVKLVVRHFDFACSGHRRVCFGHVAAMTVLRIGGPAACWIVIPAGLLENGRTSAFLRGYRNRGFSTRSRR